MLTVVHLRIVTIEIPGVHPAAAVRRHHLVSCKYNPDRETGLSAVHHSLYNPEHLVPSLEIPHVNRFQLDFVRRQKRLSLPYRIQRQVQRLLNLDLVKIRIRLHSSCLYLSVLPRIFFLLFLKVLNRVQNRRHMLTAAPALSVGAAAVHPAWLRVLISGNPHLISAPLDYRRRINAVRFLKFHNPAPVKIFLPQKQRIFLKSVHPFFHR